MTDASFSRRRLLATATALSAGALAGCFEEVDDPTAGDGVVGEGDDDSGPEEDDGEDDADSESAEAGVEETDTPTPTPEPAEPPEAGLRVVERDLRILDSSTIEADITVENVGEYTYGYIELRVDAYYSPLGRSGEEEAVGYEYAGTDRFSGFSSGTRTFEDIEIDVDSSATNPDRFRVDAAVRRAEGE